MSKCLLNCSNCYSSRIALYNTKTSKVIKPHCRTYTCPNHGWKKKKDLQDGIEKWLKSFSHVRMMTFTIRNTGEFKNEVFNYLFTKVWHLFITELRRSRLLSERERQVQYIKVYELHKLGTLHIHALLSEYIHWSKLQTIWDKCIRFYFTVAGKAGNVNVRGSKSAKSGARYVAKYVVKMAGQLLAKVRSWSKSGKVAIFAKRISSGDWIILQRDSLEYRLARVGFPILVYRVPSVTESRNKKQSYVEHPRLFKETWDHFNQIFRFLY